MCESVDKALAAQAFPGGHLDKAEAGIIDQPARSQRLDSGALQNHLRDLGFSAVLEGLWRGPAAAKEPFRRPGLAQAEEGLLHVMGMLQERDAVREEFDQSTRDGRDPREAPGDARICAGVRFELLSAESRPKIGMIPSERTNGLAKA